MTLLVALSILILPACAAAFTDVAANHWAFNEISLLTEKGIVSGMGDGTFAPDTFVTREQFIKLLVLSCGIDVFGLNTLRIIALAIRRFVISAMLAANLYGANQCQIISKHGVGQHPMSTRQ
jgi:hypothetical protein